MAQRILVTGGAGFIGSYLVAELLNRGDEVVVVDNASTGNFARLAHLCHHERLSLNHGSVCDQLLIDELACTTDSIIHLAAAVGVKYVLAHQVQGIVTNLRGTEVVLQAAAAHGHQPVFLASSSEVYGKGSRVPFNEDDDCIIGPTSLHRWSYACGKAMDEFLALAYYSERGLPLRIGRFFNITGPGQSGAYGMVLPRFCSAALRGDHIEVYGDGEQSRCFLHVADAVAAVLALLDCDEAIGSVVNIGSDVEITIAELAERVIAAAGQGTMVHVPYEDAYPEGGFEDLRRRVPSIARLQKLTGWHPERDLDTIISETLADCRRRGVGQKEEL